MNRHVVISVTGTPVPQGSKSAYAVRNGDGEPTGQVNVTEGNKALPAWRRRVRDHAKQQGPLHAGPVSVMIDFHLPRPKSHYRTGKYSHQLKDNAPVFHTKKPDVDKLVRGILDSLTMAGTYTDDNQVISATGRKFWCNPGDEHAHITALVIAPEETP